jgi:Flp pilus assembly protein TadG
MSLKMRTPMRLTPRNGTHRSSHPEAGQTTVLMALIMGTFLFGFVAMGIDTESLFHAKRQAQAAADAAAIAYAEEANYGSGAQLAAATAAAKLNGFDTANGAIITVNSPPAYGNYSTSAANAYYEVLVKAPIPVFFARVVTHQSTVMVTGRAVAGAGLASPTCVCLEGTSGTDLNLSNNSKLTPSNCGTTVDSNSSNAVELAGSATLGGLYLGTAASGWSTAQNGSNVNNGASISSSTKVVEGLTSSCAPAMPTPPTYSTGSCTADPLPGGGGNKYNVGPGATPIGGAAATITEANNTVCYNKLTVGGNGNTVTVNSGIYVINGGSLHFESGTINGGSGVFFYLIGNASLTIDNGANVNLTAFTSGPYSGILVYQPGPEASPTTAEDTQPLSIQGGSNTSFNGSIYAPAAGLTLGNGSSTAITADVVAKTLTMNGGGTLSSTASAGMGSYNASSAKVAE